MTEPRSTPPGPTSPRDDEEHEDRAPRLMRFGAAVSAAVLASIIATMPAAVRIAASLGHRIGGMSLWVALLAVAFPPLAIATVALRHALASLRLFDPKAVTSGIAALLAWGAATFAALAAIGSVLRATTHHHGLAGVTFAASGLAVAGVLALFAARVVVVLRGASPLARWIALGCAGAAVGVGVAFFARTLAHDEAAASLAVDVVAFALGAAFGAGAFPHRSRPLIPLALAGPPLAAVVLVLGFGTVRRAPRLCAALATSAPVLSALTVGALCGAVPPAEPPPAH